MVLSTCFMRNVSWIKEKQIFYYVVADCPADSRKPEASCSAQHSTSRLCSQGMTDDID